MTDPCKVVLIGESGVGKTCIIAQFINKTFDPNVVSSLTSQYIRKNIELPEGKSVLMDIWDTAGQEKHRALAKIFYKNSKAVLLVYDITRKKSFEEIKNYWYEQVKESSDKDTILALVGNKYDLINEKDVSNEDGEEFVKSIGAIFALTTATDYNSINALFESIAKKILESTNDKKFMKLKTQKEKKKDCCKV